MNRFENWMEKTFEPSELNDIAKHGADAGWRELTYTKHIFEHMHEYEDDICSIVEEVEPIYEAFAAHCKRRKLSGSPTDYAHWLVWSAAELTAYKLTEEVES